MNHITQTGNAASTESCPVCEGPRYPLDLTVEVGSPATTGSADNASDLDALPAIGGPAQRLIDIDERLLAEALVRFWWQKLADAGYSNAHIYGGLCTAMESWFPRIRAEILKSISRYRTHV